MSGWKSRRAFRKSGLSMTTFFSNRSFAFLQYPVYHFGIGGKIFEVQDF